MTGAAPLGILEAESRPTRGAAKRLGLPCPSSTVRAAAAGSPPPPSPASTAAPWPPSAPIAPAAAPAPSAPHPRFPIQGASAARAPAAARPARAASGAGPTRPRMRRLDGEALGRRASHGARACDEGWRPAQPGRCRCRAPAIRSPYQGTLERTLASAKGKHRKARGSFRRVRPAAPTAAAGAARRRRWRARPTRRGYG